MNERMARYRRWLRFNLFYLGRPTWDTGVSPPELIELLKSAKPGWALDVGCGTGTNLSTMAQYGWEVVGADFAWLSVLKARQALKKLGKKPRVYYTDVARKTGISAKFDLVLDMGCYHGLAPSQRERYRLNLKNWLKPGGIYLLYAHTRALSEQRHGITEEDIAFFQEFLRLTWRHEGKEIRPDGGGGKPSVWARFDRNLIW